MIFILTVSRAVFRLALSCIKPDSDCLLLAAGLVVADRRAKKRQGAKKP
ncbi:hypothetical protein D2M30_1179 [Bacillus amyloliquefaciens]|nr:hypothetical protein D2M30_1179 [Bacillus amyloliquefaciens]